MDNFKKISGENFECFPLEWDTNYFGVNSARVNLKGKTNSVEQNQILEYCKAFEFITIANIGNFNDNNFWIGRKTNAFLVDINIQFFKRTMQLDVINDERIKIYNSYQGNKKVLEIAKSTFTYSRFYNDPLLPQEQARNVYLNWTKNAFRRDDKYFVIATINEDIAGYLLFSIDEQKTVAVIELISTNNNYRGKGVGKSLIFNLESFLYRNEIFNIKVGTQLDNIKAIQFYTSCGFEYINCSSIYHLWNHF